MTLDRKDLPELRGDAESLANAMQRISPEQRTMPRVVVELIDEVLFLDQKIDGAREMLKLCEQGLTHALHPYGDREAAEQIHNELKLMLNDYPAWLKKKKEENA